jgi:diguanylate cyclase (GGDEF)-like protein
MDPTHNLIADSIGAGEELDARRRFWLTHMLLGFGVFLMETLVVMLYLALTPDGPHRALLWGITALWLASAVVGLAFAPFIATRPWRSTYSVWWTIASTFAVGLVAVFDGGVTSPILLLIFLPLVYGTLMFTARSAAVCGVSALVTLSLAAAVDRGLVAAEGRTFMLFASVAGAAVLSATAAVNRSHIECHEASLMAALADLASTDELTGCTVRRVLRQRTEVEIERSMRSGSPLSLLMIDVDHFKAVNDNFGHVVGDRVLAAVGRVLLANVRTFDVASRLGGDEFALLLPETDVKSAVVVAERIFRNLAGECEVPITVSIGVSSLDRTLPTAEHLFDEADMALYQVKRTGRDAVAVRAPGALSPINC